MMPAVTQIDHHGGRRRSISQHDNDPMGQHVYNRLKLRVDLASHQDEEEGWSARDLAGQKCVQK